MNEVKLSTGFKKPENKGKRYFECANCEKYHWDTDVKVEGNLLEEAKPSAPASKFDDIEIRKNTVKFVFECIEDAQGLFAGVDSDKKGYGSINLNEIIDHIRRTRISLIIDRNAD